MKHLSKNQNKINSIFGSEMMVPGIFTMALFSLATFSREMH